MWSGRVPSQRKGGGRTVGAEGSSVGSAAGRELIDGVHDELHLRIFHRSYAQQAKSSRPVETDRGLRGPEVMAAIDLGSVLPMPRIAAVGLPSETGLIRPGPLPPLSSERVAKLSVLSPPSTTSRQPKSHSWLSVLCASRRSSREDSMVSVCEGRSGAQPCG